MAAKEKKGLGIGLDALFAANEMEDDQTSELLTLPINKVEPRREQPREYFDEQALQDLSESISQYGLIQPVIARKLDNGYYQIIAGERRWRAARMAGLSEVPVVIIEADDRKAMELAMIENLQRENLNFFEEAEGMRRVTEVLGITQEQLAARLGISAQSVSKWEANQSLPETTTIIKIAKTFDVSADYLLCISNDKDNTQKTFEDTVSRLREIQFKNNFSNIKFFSSDDSSQKQAKVQIMTLHKSKGDEFDYVFIPELTQDNLCFDVEKYKLKENSKFIQKIKNCHRSNVTVHSVPVTSKNPSKICFANGFLLYYATFSYALSSKC